MDDGFIVLHRKLINWEWYDCLNTKCLFIHCLLMANWEQKKWRGKTIKRGQFITSFPSLAKGSGLTVREVRTSLKRLESTHELTHESTHHYTLVSVLNYNNYQNKTTHESTRQATDERHSNDIQTTTTNNDNNKNKKNNIYREFQILCPFDPFEKAADFPSELQDEINRIMQQAFLTYKFSQDEQLDFIDYWFSADVNGYPVFMNTKRNFNPSRKASYWKQNSDDENMTDSERLKKLLEDD